MLDEYIAWLRTKIALDEEAQDPEGLLPGLYWALKTAQDGVRRAAETRERVHLTVWADSSPLAALSGIYEGRDGIAEGFSAVTLTVLDLWRAGESGIQIEINRTEGEDDGEDR